MAETYKSYERAYLEIGNVCNLNCSFCQKSKREKRIMTTEETSLALWRLAGYVKYVYLHVMGEPLLHPALDEILLQIKKYGMRACITTNGTLLGKRGDALLRHADVLHKVSVSLHAPEGNGNYELTEYVETVCDFAREAAAAGIFTVLRLWNLDSELHSGKNTQNAKIEGIIRERLGDGWQRRGMGFKVCERVFIEYGEVFEWPSEASGEERDRLYCHALSGQLAVLSDGTVVPCCLDADGHMALGNIFKDELGTILASPRAVAIREGFAKKQAVEPLCRKCTYARRFKT
ncbi:MAG: radical SAM protein [Clostridia bacterium]|nr:radical SAM protein [Clostridia bacterium]